MLSRKERMLTHVQFKVFLLLDELESFTLKQAAEALGTDTRRAKETVRRLKIRGVLEPIERPGQRRLLFKRGPRYDDFEKALAYRIHLHNTRVAQNS